MNGVDNAINLYFIHHFCALSISDGVEHSIYYYVGVFTVQSALVGPDPIIVVANRDSKILIGVLSQFVFIAI